MGVALGVQVGHVVTYRGSPGGSLIYTVFTKKWQKRSKRGYPLFLTLFREGFGYYGTPHPRLAPRRPQTTPFAILVGRLPHLEEYFRRGGYQVPETFKKYPI